MQILQAVLCRVFAIPQIVVRQAPCPLFLGFSRQEYQSGFQFPPSENLPDLGIKSSCLMPSALAGRVFITSTTWEDQFSLLLSLNFAFQIVQFFCLFLFSFVSFKLYHDHCTNFCTYFFETHPLNQIDTHKDRGGKEGFLSIFILISAAIF